MAITKEFLSLFNDFVVLYKRNGTPSFLTWSKEQNHEKISQSFEDLKEIIERNQETFNDSSIIEHLNTTVLLSAKTNPYLLECWIEFLKKYNNVANVYTPFANNLIKVGPEGAMLLEFQAALTANINALVSAQKAHSLETEQYRNQIAQLTAENKQLQSQVSQQQLEIRDQAHLVSMIPQLEEAPQQLAKIQGLFMDLLAGINHKTDTKYTVLDRTLSSDMQKHSQKAIPTPSAVISPLIQKGNPELPKPAASVIIAPPHAPETAPGNSEKPSGPTAPPPPPPPTPLKAAKFFDNELSDKLKSQKEKVDASLLDVEKKNSM